MKSGALESRSHVQLPGDVRRATPEPMSTRTRDVLYREEAVERAERIFDVSYALDVELQQGQDAYSGHTRLSFRLLETTAPVFLDFTGLVTSMSIVRVVGMP